MFPWQRKDISMKIYDDTITLDIREYIDYGLHVYDVSSTKVGTVDEYDRATGYMIVRANPLSEKDLYIPFNAVTHIDPRDLFVAGTKEELHRKYADPPPRTTVVTEKIDPNTGDDASEATTTEPNGYDGRPVIVQETNVGRMGHDIAPGFHVYSSEMEALGTVKHYDHETKQMLVEHGIFSRQDVKISLALVAMVDRDDRDVILAVSSADLKRMQALGTSHVMLVGATESR